MADNLSITQHIIPNMPQYTAPPAPQYAPPPPQQYAPPPQQYAPSFMQQQAYYASQPPIKNPLVGALIGLSGIIVILIILLICSIMGLFNDMNGGSSSGSSSSSSGNNSGNNSGGHSGRNNQFKNKKSNENDPSGWQLYTLQGCGHCDKQLEDLANFNTYVKYKRGEATPMVNNIKGELYPREKITGFPLWYNSQTKEVKMGRQKNICDLNPKIKSENC